MTSQDTLSQAAGLAEGARTLVQAPWDDLSGSEAVVAAEAISAARGVLDACLLRVTDRLMATEPTGELGWASIKDYLTHLTGGHKGAGGGLVRVLGQLRNLPRVQAALEEGAISLPQARSIATGVHKLPRQAPEFREKVADALVAAVINDGQDASALQGKVFDDIVAALDPEGKIIDLERDRHRTERGVHASRFLSLSPDKVGGIRLKGYGTPEDAEKIKAALFPLSAPVTTEPGICGGRCSQPGEELFDEHGNATRWACLEPGCAHDGRDPRDHGARFWDALVEACDRLAATETLPRDHGAVPRVIVTIDHESLIQKLIDAGVARAGETPNGTSLSAQAIRRMACDAEIIPAVLGTQGQVLDVGRANRLVTPAIWTALIARDKHCAFPGCTRPPLASDAHHIVHWADGGETSLDNMVMLCRHHHTVVHQTPWCVAIDPETKLPVWTPPKRRTLADLEGKVSYWSPRYGHYVNSLPPRSTPPRSTPRSGSGLGRPDPARPRPGRSDPSHPRSSRGPAHA